MELRRGRVRYTSQAIGRMYISRPRDILQLLATSAGIDLFSLRQKTHLLVADLKAVGYLPSRRLVDDRAMPGSTI